MLITTVPNLYYFEIAETSGLKDTTQVENLQDQVLSILIFTSNYIFFYEIILVYFLFFCYFLQALAMLRNHIESSSPSNTTRFGRLLMLLANLRFGNAHRIEKTFFEKIIGNAKMEKLLCDMFQSQTNYLNVGLPMFFFVASDDD